MRVSYQISGNNALLTAANAILNASIMGMPPSLFSVMVKNLLHEFEEMLEDMLKHRYGPALKPHLLCY
jgi:DNA-directed RNA polymerase alpha subunit